MHFLITGTAGFIGFHLAKRLIADGHTVTGVDGMTNYYDVKLKHARHALLSTSNAFRAHEVMLEDMDGLERAIGAEKPDVIVHLAAQAGVRYSLENPRSYAVSNLDGTFNVMELARAMRPKHFLLASTSSVYGANTKLPFTEMDRTDHPTTFYAATKKATEDMAHSYAHLWKLPTTAFRFFTVYGPWGRPDMALFKFVRAALAGETIDVYGNGQMSRDFTYIDDLIEGIVRLADCVPVEGAPLNERDSLSPAAPYRVVNIGGGKPTGLMAFIESIERSLGVTMTKNVLGMQQGELVSTHAAADLLKDLTGYLPTTDLDEGVDAFVAWYRGYYGA